jgi:general secretion pathway protein F
MQFAYKVSDARGRMETGRAEAESREQLIARFKSQGKFPLEVKAEGKGKGAAATVKAPGGGIKAQERLIFTQQLGGLLSSGISIERALEIMSRLANNVRITELVRQLKRSLQEGHSFTNALEMFPKHFPTLYISMVRAGEAGGILAQVLK